MRSDLYHGTLTGANDEVLRAFQTQGIQTRPGWTEKFHQKDGFFVESDRKQSENKVHDLYRLRDRKVGRPLIVTVESDFSRGWELDYEEATRVAKEILFDYQEVLSRVPADTLRLPGSAYLIHSITPVHTAKKDGLRIELINKNSYTKKAIFMHWDRENLSKKGIPDAGLLQVLRDYLVSALGDTYLAHEKDMIESAVERYPNVSLKYAGTHPPKIAKIETFDGSKWVEEPLALGASLPPPPFGKER